MEVNPEQLSKAQSPIFVTLFGIVMDVKLEQISNAKESMCVTLSGIVIDVKDRQSRKAHFPTPTTGQPPRVAGISRGPASNLDTADVMSSPVPTIANPFEIV